jgi:hypothetical protein
MVRRNLTRPDERPCDLLDFLPVCQKGFLKLLLKKT